MQLCTHGDKADHAITLEEAMSQYLLSLSLFRLRYACKSHAAKKRMQVNKTSTTTWRNKGEDVAWWQVIETSSYANKKNITQGTLTAPLS